MKDNRGFSLIEILISMLVLVFVFSMFSVIISGYYRQHIELGINKQQREEQVANVEKMLANEGSDSPIGTLKVTLNTSSIPNETADREIECDIVRKNYGGNKFFYVYASK